jgi:hypothetical protein
LAAILDNASPATLPEIAGGDVEAFGIVQASPEAIAVWRKKPPAAPGVSPPANLLKYADDQTVAAVAAVFMAIQDFRLEDRSFTDWGVVAAPRFLGRLSVIGALERFPRQGAPGVSPLLIPYLSLHVLSGTISLALHSHGPNIGTGGGQGSMGEALLTALTLQAEHPSPGTWVVVTEWDPEPILDEKGRNTVPSVCQAVALALVPGGAEPFRPRLRYLPPAPLPANDRPPAPASPPPSIASLAGFLKSLSEGNSPPSWSYPLGWGGRLELARTEVAARPSFAA